MVPRRAVCSLRLALLAAARPRALSTSAAAPNATCERRVRVEVVADVVCPWCYIGLSRMQGALAAAEAEGVTVDVTYTPFILRRHLPKEGIDKFAMFEQMFGSASAVRQKYAGIARAAAAEGLCFDPEEQLAGNSEDAQRLMLWANDRAQPHAGAHFRSLLTELFVRYNCHRAWLGDHAALVEAADAVGLDGAEAAALLAGQRYGAELEAGLARAAALGATSVPLYVVGGGGTAQPLLIRGAVEADELTAAIRQMAAG
eukprot:COSAG04_NODE_3883_length_2451_cov_2.389031_3_plen_258_part_00